MKCRRELSSSFFNGRRAGRGRWLTGLAVVTALVASPMFGQDTMIIEGDNVGIGTSNPTSDLTIRGDGLDHHFTILRPSNDIAFEVQKTGNNVIKADAPGYYWIETDAGGQFWGTTAVGGEYRVRDLTAGTYPLRIEKTAPTNSLFVQSTGRVGLGTTTPGSRLEIQDLTVEGPVLRLTDSNAFCNLDPDPGQLTISCPSDVRLKKNVRRAATARLLQELLSIDLFEYEVIRTEERAVGPVAQNLRATHPQRVTEAEDGTLLVSLPGPSELIGAIQELHRLVAHQQDTMKQQRELITSLQQRLQELEPESREGQRQGQGSAKE